MTHAAKRKSRSDPLDRPGGIQYAGESGISADCKDAVVRLLQHGDRIAAARILTCATRHCLLLTISDGELVAVKSGFASGYGGEGPTAFSYVLQLLDAHGVDVDEFEVAEAVIERLDRSSLTESDLVELASANRVRPSRWFQDYIEVQHRDSRAEGTLWQEFPLVIPFAIVDPRLVDLALSFWDAPDDKLMTAYRRLEDITRKRTGIDEHGSKLFSRAFMGPTAKLHWPEADDSEQAGRAQLFTASFGAFRNPRAHREKKDRREDLLAEFLLLNQLFRLEKEAVPNPANSES